MTLTRFVTKSAFRNKRRSVLTVLSIAFSLLLLTLMMTIWHAFYMRENSEQESQRLVTRHRVSLTFMLPMYYRQKIKTIPGVVDVMTPTHKPSLAGDPDAKTNPFMFRIEVLQNDRVRYPNQPIAVVIAETLEAATEGAALLAPKYEVLPARAHRQRRGARAAVEEDGRGLAGLRRIREEDRARDPRGGAGAGLTRGLTPAKVRASPLPACTPSTSTSSPRSPRTASSRRPAAR